jgi:hypothetical protein
MITVNIDYERLTEYIAAGFLVLTVLGIFYFGYLEEHNRSIFNFEQSILARFFRFTIGGIVFIYGAFTCRYGYCFIGAILIIYAVVGPLLLDVMRPKKRDQTDLLSDGQVEIDKYVDSDSLPISDHNGEFLRFFEFLFSSPGKIFWFVLLAGAIFIVFFLDSYQTINEFFSTFFTIIAFILTAIFIGFIVKLIFIKKTINQENEKRCLSNFLVVLCTWCFVLSNGGLQNWVQSCMEVGTLKTHIRWTIFLTIVWIDCGIFPLHDGNFHIKSPVNCFLFSI